MGAAVSVTRLGVPSQSQRGEASVAPEPSSAATASATSTQLARPTFSIWGAMRPARKHLETAITTLVADLSLANAKCTALERDLQEERYEREQQGVPHTECVVCMAACVSTVLVPCGHLCLCINCADSIKKSGKSTACPLCRVEVTQMHRVFLPVEEMAPPMKPKILELEVKENKEPQTPTASGFNPPTPDAADMGIQVSPSLRGRGVVTPRLHLGRSYSEVSYSGGRAHPLHPAPRVYKREDGRPTRMAPRGLNVQLSTTAQYDDDIIRRPSGLIRPPPTYGEAARPQADAESPIEVRGSPEERPSAFDFVLPGAFVPERNPAFAATWDGAMRVRDSTD